MQKISWIGVGIMGKAMVRNLMKVGYEVHIYARHPEKVADVISEGAVPHGSIAECVKASEVVITMVGFPKEVYGWYKSASLHTGKKKIPRAVWTVLATVVLVPIMGYLAITGVYKNVTKGAPQAAEASAATPGAVGATDAAKTRV